MTTKRYKQIKISSALLVVTILKKEKIIIKLSKRPYLPRNLHKALGIEEGAEIELIIDPVKQIILYCRKEESIDIIIKAKNPTIWEKIITHKTEIV